MGKNTVIEVEHVSMKFNLASEKYDSLKEYVIKSIRRCLFSFGKGRFPWFDRAKWKWKEYNVKNNCRSTEADERKCAGLWYDCTID